MGAGGSMSFKPPRPRGWTSRGPRWCGAGGVGVDAVKNPLRMGHGTQRLMYVSTSLTPWARAHVAGNQYDGHHTRGAARHWPSGRAGAGRHRARLGSVVPFGGVSVGYYDGAADPAQTPRSGAGSPLGGSPELAARLRRCARPHLAPRDGLLALRRRRRDRRDRWAYYEYTRADRSHECDAPAWCARCRRRQPRADRECRDAPRDAGDPRGRRPPA